MFVKSKTAALLLGVSLLALQPALAQQQQQAGAKSVPVQAAVIGPDLHGLRYFAKLDDLERYELELRRLQQLYPGFRIDRTSLLQKDETNDQLWELFGEQDFGELKSRIEKRQLIDPYWKPDPNLLKHLELQERRQAIIDAFDAEEYSEVLTLSAGSKGLLSPHDAELIWIVAETLTNLEDTSAAIAAFEYSVSSGSDRQIIEVLYQKIAEHLPVSDAAALLRHSRTHELDEGERRELHHGFARGLIARANQKLFQIPLNFIELVENFGEAALAADALDDVEGLAWAFYNQEDFEKAIHWFSHFEEDENKPKILEGKILSLKGAEMFEEARVLSHTWRHVDEEISALYVNLHAPLLLEPKAKRLSRDFLGEFASEVNRIDSGEGAEALAWYAFNVKQFETSAAWFDKAIEWELTETAAYGRTLVAAQVDDEEAFEEFKRLYRADYPTVAELKYREKYKQVVHRGPRRNNLSIKLAKANQAGKYRTCIALSDQLIRAGQSSANDYQIRGWCLLKLERPEEARIAFAKAKKGKTSAKNKTFSSYGAALSALKQKRTSEAARILESGHLTRPQYRTILKGVLAQQALVAFDRGQYQSVLALLNRRANLEPEPRNLTELRGWSFFRLGNYNAAYNTFMAMDQVLSTQVSREGLNATRRVLTQYLENGAK